jgi:hypothetical protein
VKVLKEEREILKKARQALGYGFFAREENQPRR